MKQDMKDCFEIAVVEIVSTHGRLGSSTWTVELSRFNGLDKWRGHAPSSVLNEFDQWHETGEQGKGNHFKVIEKGWIGLDGTRYCEHGHVKQSN